MVENIKTTSYYCNLCTTVDPLVQELCKHTVKGQPYSEESSIAGYTIFSSFYHFHFNRGGSHSMKTSYLQIREMCKRQILNPEPPSQVQFFNCNSPAQCTASAKQDLKTSNLPF